MLTYLPSLLVENSWLIRNSSKHEESAVSVSMWNEQLKELRTITSQSLLPYLLPQLLTKLSLFVLFLHFFNNRLYHHAHDICIHHTLHFISIKHCVCHTSYILLCSYKVWEHVSKIKTTKFIMFCMYALSGKMRSMCSCEGDQTTKSQNSALVTKSWTWT